MQFNRSASRFLSGSVDTPTPSLQDRIGERIGDRPSVKRSFSQDASLALSQSPPNPAPVPPAKLPRSADNTGKPSAFSSARRDTTSMASSSRRKPQPTSNAGPSASASSSHPHLPTGPSSSRGRKGGKRGGAVRGLSHLQPPAAPPANLLEGPYHDEACINQLYNPSGKPLKVLEKESSPKGPLNNFYMTARNKLAEYVTVPGQIMRGNTMERIHRTTVTLDIGLLESSVVIGIGDHPDKKQSLYNAALSALYQLRELGVLDNPKRLAPPKAPTPQVSETKTLSDGSIVDYDKARSFMEYYCRIFGFGKPELDFQEIRNKWEATMTVGERRIGIGHGVSKKQSQIQCFLDVTGYLEECDPELWKKFVEAAKTGKDLGMAPSVAFNVSTYIEDSIEEICHDIRRTTLYKNRPSRHAVSAQSSTSAGPGAYVARPPRAPRAAFAAKSNALLARRKEYLADPSMAKMRETRAALPVYTQAKEVLAHIANNDVTICMAATGSGKTTQIPQMILDEYIERGEGASCNIVCTQPRRLAALSVADRVAKERGETVGKSIGYHVRFESKLPEPNGSVTFCTTGVFLKRLQSILSGHDDHGRGEFENLSHIVVDEVHERDVDTDLLLVVLKQLLAQRKEKNQPLKVVLMSATIDPTLFQKYFPDEKGAPADTISVPGRSFPVTKYFMDDFTKDILSGPLRWVKDQDNVARYIHRELGHAVSSSLGIRPPNNATPDGELELPYPFIAAAISHVLQASEDGHVLVFLPGWDEIAATQRALLSPVGPLGINFSSSQYSLHLLHSSVPLPEQQAIFEPPARGVRRVILATNIAETSVTIPDVVYVIDTAKIKEQRYDPDRHMSSLVSAWVGSSNLNQRAGRAGRHRSGEYFGILGKARADTLLPHQTVEMKRVDLSNVVMHVKALNLPGMSVEEVLAAAIEPPDPTRVSAAMRDLQMVGALDSEKNLSSLGRVLLQLPVDAQMGRLVLYGSFFRCLDQALTLAALITNREPFMSPMHVRLEAQRVKNSWSPPDFRSDVLAALRAYNAWWELQSNGEYIRANRFCSDNFLSKPTLLMVQRVKTQLLQSLYRAGVIQVSAGGELDSRYDMSARNLTVPPALNVNKDSLPLLTALITIAAQPKFAIRTSKQGGYRTANDKFAMIHPSSVNNRKQEVSLEAGPVEEKQLYAFADKRRNDTTAATATTFLVNTTRLDPLTYILFGAYNVEVVRGGLECDDWLPVKGDGRTLDDLWRLKTSMEACMLRVFEGITMSRQRRGQKLTVVPREQEDEAESGDEMEDMKDYSLSREEARDLDVVTRAVVNLLNSYSDERIASQSTHNSRAGTPVGSPYSTASRLPPSGPASGYNTPYMQSRPGTPSRLRSGGGRLPF